MNVCWTVDVEHDCPPFLTTCHGIDEGMPRLLELFEQEQVRGTFFITGDIARRFPGTVAAIRDGGHEIGCHGDTHTPFDTLDEATAREEIQASSAVLREFDSVTSFRAPNLRFPDRYVAILEAAGYRLDSSQAKYKRTYWFRGPLETRLARRAGLDDVIGVAHPASVCAIRSWEALLTRPCCSSTPGNLSTFASRHYGSTAASAPGRRPWMPCARTCDSIASWEPRPCGWMNSNQTHCRPQLRESRTNQSQSHGSITFICLATP